jgi:hypothetical protein
VRLDSLFSSSFYFERISIHTHATLRENISGENGPDLSPPFFVPIRWRLSLFSLSLSLARRDLSAPTMRALLSLSLTHLFFSRKSSISRFAEMIVALKKLCGIADIELTVRFGCCCFGPERESKNERRTLFSAETTPLSLRHTHIFNFSFAFAFSRFSARVSLFLASRSRL